VTGFILAVPCVEKGKGGGHLLRMANLVRELRGYGKTAFLFIDSKTDNDKTALTRLDALTEDFNSQWIIRNDKELKKAGKWDLIVLDRFETPPEEYAAWSSLAPVAGIDEGGKARDDFDFLIDLLPRLKSASGGPPNLTAASFLPLPGKRRPSFRTTARPGSPNFRYCITFGAEDSAGLGGLVSEALGAEPVKTIPNLREKLHEYDLVITHFGLTAFEALRARVPALLISPTNYHEKLAKEAGFVSVRRRRRVSGLAKKLTSSLFETIVRASEKIAAKYDLETGNAASLASYLSSADPAVAPFCPACGTKTEKPVARFPERTYRRCRHCGIICMDRLTPPPIEYAKDYFFDQYKAQYGKTYLEDFENLKSSAKTRLTRIKNILQKKHPCILNPESCTLLDIGSAYGPFLAAAKEEGFTAKGLEPAEDAAVYVREKLGIDCITGFFPGALSGNTDRYDVITLWYVIEHFTDPGPVLDEIRTRLNSGGILAFSTPNYAGVSGLKSIKTFLKNSPADHWSVWSPRSAKKILAVHGFKLIKTAVTGHHPERFPVIGKLLQKRKGLLYRFCVTVSRVFRLGDTFEAYVKKHG